jgi:hypothetical protein
MLILEKPDARLYQSFTRPAAAAGPIALARRDLNKTLSRRFYKEVAENLTSVSSSFRKLF